MGAHPRVYSDWKLHLGLAHDVRILLVWKPRKQEAQMDLKNAITYFITCDCRALVTSVEEETAVQSGLKWKPILTEGPSTCVLFSMMSSTL